jgi:hypothetical protein
MKYILRRTLINATHRLESLAKQLRGAADKVLPEKRLFLGDCEAQNWENIRPCFVLSTGRCGTLLLNNILTLSPDANALHVPQPEMHRPSRRAYEQVTQQPEIFREVFKSAREEYLLAAARQDKVYIETNNQVTFFAPIICDVFPRTVFIHLVRHPGSFVRSGIRRKWYTGNNPYDVGRIVPQEDELKKKWDQWSLIDKIGWLWNETNRFIEGFKQTLPPESVLFVKAEDLFKDPRVTERIFEFAQIGGFNEKVIAKVIRKPVNVQKKGDFPPYKEWSEEDIQKLRNVAMLAGEYGYRL